MIIPSSRRFPRVAVGIDIAGRAGRAIATALGPTPTVIIMGSAAQVEAVALRDTGAAPGVTVATRRITDDFPTGAGNSDASAIRCRLGTFPRRSRYQPRGSSNSQGSSLNPPRITGRAPHCGVSVTGPLILLYLRAICIRARSKPWELCYNPLYHHAYSLDIYRTITQ